jgi:hypothetical protein
MGRMAKCHLQNESANAMHRFEHKYAPYSDAEALRWNGRVDQFADQLAYQFAIKDSI